MNNTLSLNFGASSALNSSNRIELILSNSLLGQGDLYITSVYVDTPSSGMIALDIVNPSSMRPAQNVTARARSTLPYSPCCAHLLIAPSTGLTEFQSPIPWSQLTGITLQTNSITVAVFDWNGAAITYNALIVQCHSRTTMSQPQLPITEKRVRDAGGELRFNSLIM